jgi:glycosyltransferase involved in cell wall biosynthesis
MGKRKTILMISALDFWSMGKGKGGPALWRTLTGYAERGWTVFFITGNSMKGDAPDLPDNIRVIRFDSYWLKRLLQIKKLGFFFKAIWWGWFQWRSFIEAQKLHATCKVDVVYGYEIYGVPVAKALSKAWSVPMISRFQGTSFRAGWRGKRFRKIRAWQHLVALRGSADLVIMTNDGTQGDRVLENVGANMDRVRFWMNGVDWDSFDSLPEQPEARKQLSLAARYVLLCISRLENWKHVERSIHALPSVVKDFPDTVLVIIGSGSEKEKLQSIACELGAGEHVLFGGAVPHEEIPQYLAAADVFLSLYDWSNVGNPLLEAMMAGKCVVTLNNGDTRRFIKNKENGILLEYDEIAKLPTVVKGLLADEGQRQDLGEQARMFAVGNFWSWADRMDAEVDEVAMLVEMRGKVID